MIIIRKTNAKLKIIKNTSKYSNCRNKRPQNKVIQVIKPQKKKGKNFPN